VGDTHTADSASLADVTTAYEACVDGDVLAIPAGAETWAGTLTVAKGITVQGAGSASTVLTADGAARRLITLAPGSDKACRLTGIGFVDGKGASVAGAGDGSYCLTQVRVDNCKFTRLLNGGENLLVQGWVEGCVDHNTFLNCNLSIRIIGDDNRAWARTFATGTEHALFIEDNTFTHDGSAISGLNECIYHQQGARTVIRYNAFDASAYGDFFSPIDVHGNWGDGVVDPESADAWDYRGQTLVEVYENTFTYDKAYRVCYFRGGSILMHDNTFTSVTSTAGEIVLSDEESWQTALFSPLREAWPAKDQIFNSFFWNNTLDSVAITAIDLQDSEKDAVFIQENRDYFMHAPAATGGKSTYPGDPGDDDMTFSAEGANAYYPYTPYTYPHPLQGEAETYAVVYADNGATSGSVPSDGSSPYNEGESVTVLGNTGGLARESYRDFVGWNTQADGEGTDYLPGATLTMPAANVTLYAQWKLKCALIAG